MGDPSRSATAVAVAFLLLAVAGPAAAQPLPLAQSQVDPDTVVMRVDVAADGDATWAVEYRVRLDDENATAAFESVQADVEENASAFTDRFATGMARTVRSAENVTGREMALRNVTVTAETERLPQEYGVVTYRFTWTGFAAVEGDRIRAGDALSGLFLDAESSLVVGYPDGYGVADVRPDPAENRTNAVVWRGRTDFGTDEPRVVLSRSATGNGGGAGGGPGVPLLVAGAFVALAALAGGWLVVARRGDDAGLAPDAGGDSPDGPSADRDGAGDDRSSAATGARGASATGAGDDEPPAELLSNEERVIRLLEGEGGRIKQQRIAEEFDWTDAKTSQVVGNLREEDAVETFRIGRENVVTLPEESEF